MNEPSEGLGEVIGEMAGLRTAINALAGGSGPVAIDAERAHGFRYSQRAYLIQLRRHDAGTFLIDPVALAEAAAADGISHGEAAGTRTRSSRTRPLADLSNLAEAIEDAEWDIHAANQDLPCLAEVNLIPQRLFDTELAGRLLGYPRVNLGTLIEEVFSVRLLKEHSAADWSTRPLPREWLNYAALDVELLVELRDALAEQLVRAGKDEWARQEFAWLAAGAGRPAAVRPDPWRRTSGIHKIRSRRGLAIVAELWHSRDQIARRTDNAPGRILPDSAITELAAIRNPSASSLREVPGFNRRAAARYRANWVAALERALALSERELPALHRHASGPPQQARLWAGKDPVAAARLYRVRDALADKAEELNLPAENLLTPDYLRRLTWRPPTELTERSVNDLLGGFGARPWQREIVVPLITPLLVDA
ncbi:ribonuclease D [Microlunatus elymi]|uniref:Ribonuclease D n=1 Tax=Microlunatus elymi TaxID=2596828 RepID=A0A516Q5P1_9ACTN|nr:ribonuclease D [Microlunatus elymi]